MWDPETHHLMIKVSKITYTTYWWKCPTHSWQFENYTPQQWISSCFCVCTSLYGYHPRHRMEVYLGTIILLIILSRSFSSMHRLVNVCHRMEIYLGTIILSIIFSRSFSSMYRLIHVCHDLQFVFHQLFSRNVFIIQQPVWAQYSSPSVLGIATCMHMEFEPVKSEMSKDKSCSVQSIHNKTRAQYRLS